MRRSMLHTNSIAELRRPKETAEFFDSLPSEEQIQEAKCGSAEERPVRERAMVLERQ